MGILNRFRSPEERQRREFEKAAFQAEQARAAAERLAEQRRAAEAAEEQRKAAAEAQQRARLREILGDELVSMEVNTPEEAKIAIKLARLRKKEIQGEKRELAADLADAREGWRDRQAGRYSTVGLGRGTSGRIIRSGIQAGRRSERMAHAGQVNEFSDARQELDQRILVIDKLIIDLERTALRKP